MNHSEPNGKNKAAQDDPPPQTFSVFPALKPPGGIRLSALPERPCPYLPGKTAKDRAAWADSLPASLYEKFMNQGFRRSGRLLYQPVCRGCRSCMPIRLPIAEFSPSKSQRRAWRGNSDLSVQIGPPTLTDEKFELYQRYLRQWHHCQVPEDFSGLQAFLYDSPLETTLEFEYRDSQARLVGVGICDRCPAILSSVYFYFEPDESARSLGTFSALYEIDFAANAGLAFYYLGYWIEGCGAMKYKQLFSPAEILHSDGQWRRLSYGVPSVST